MSEKPKNENFVSPEYKSNCIEWALRTHPGLTAEEVIAAAKKFYGYVYGTEDGE